MLARLATTNWAFLAISLALNLVSVWIRSWRWYYLFPPGSQPSHLFSAVMIGYMANNILPLRAGEVVRVYIASRHGPRFWTSVATLVVERVLDGLAVGLILAVALPHAADPARAALARHHLPGCGRRGHGRARRHRHRPRRLRRAHPGLCFTAGPASSAGSWTRWAP